MTKERSTWQKILWLLLAYVTLAIAVIGAFLPILPTTPFLLVAVWAGSHASSKFKWWLLRHKRFGPGLRDWYRDKAIAKRAKIAAVTVIAVSWLIIILNGSPTGVIVLTGLIFVGCISFLLSRPDPSKIRQ
ncbi:MAG: YbaN family protein [Gammaproteobacteria bacterium]|nr:YbaN family protein [Gammaproteobacteria bacterium]